LIAVFLRHYGCSFCKEQVIELRKHYQTVVNTGAEVVCVAMGPYKAGRAFQIVMELPFEILTTGESIEPFRAYGLGKASVAQLLNPVMWWRVLVNMTRGIFNNPLQAQGDLAQMSGTFVIGTDGRFLHVNPAKSAYQVVAVDELLRYIPAG
jgi:peroxiredoxin